MSYDVGQRPGSDSTLPWLWHRPAAAALIQPLAWKLPYAVSVAPKKWGKKKERKKYEKSVGGHHLPGSVEVSCIKEE